MIDEHERDVKLGQMNGLNPMSCCGQDAIRKPSHQAVWGC